MTVAQPGNTGLVPAGAYEGVGLEDIDATDLVMPRISISHQKAVFVNSVTKEEYETLTCIMLAMVKQRVMWDKDVDENYKQPQCKSPDFSHGFPNIDPKAPAKKLFPWSESVFDATAGREGRYQPEVIAEVGLPSLPCDKCSFKEWHDKKTRCKEQHTYPVLVQAADGGWSPAILTLQGSAVRASKTYAGGFASARQNLFICETVITLQANQRGTVQYATPSLRRGAATDVNDHAEFAAQAGTIRNYLRAFPTARDEDDAVVSGVSNANTIAPPTPATVIEHQPVAVAPPPQPTAPVTATAPVEPPAQPAQPAQPAPAAPVAVPPPATTPAPAPAAPPAEPAAPPAEPVAPPVQPAPPVAVPEPVQPAAVPPPAPAAPQAPSQELPF